MSNKRRIQVLDCTLRDGGCVNDFNFGSDYMSAIKDGLENSGVDIIECGYMDENKGSKSGRTQFIDDKAIETSLLTRKSSLTEYVAMFDYGKFDCGKLQSRSGTTIDGIRIAFHKKNRFDILDMCRTVLGKGYDLYIQPMAIMRYTDREILDLIDLINHEIPAIRAFYIVDSFGEMRLDDFRRILFLVDNNLNTNISIGFHSHNNLQLSYANAIQLIEHRTARNVIIDSSIMGMGKGAGNLNTELLLDHLNHSCGTEYEIKPLLDVIDRVINQFRQKYRWGYSVEFFLSSRNSCTPSYAQYFYEKHMLTIEQISELLKMMSEEKKISFDRKYAEKIYFEYNNRCVAAEDGLEALQKDCAGKKVLLIAPGKSIIKYQSKIEEWIADKDVVSILINTDKVFTTDYIFVNKAWLYGDISTDSGRVIGLSNVDAVRPGDIILNYEQWVSPDEESADNSLMILMKLLSKLGVQDVFLAGFDGFSYDSDQNYYSEKLRRNLSVTQIDAMNRRVVNAIKKFGKNMNLQFVTPSKYPEMLSDG